jgi:hypothetical protein
VMNRGAGARLRERDRTRGRRDWVDAPDTQFIGTRRFNSSN